MQVTTYTLDGGRAGGDPGPRAASLRGWALIFTSLDSMLGTAEVGGLLSEMAVLVADKSVEVRSAAGEVVALLCRRVHVYAGQH